MLSTRSLSAPRYLLLASFLLTAGGLSNPAPACDAICEVVGGVEQAAGGPKPGNGTVKPDASGHASDDKGETLAEGQIELGPALASKAPGCRELYLELFERAEDHLPFGYLKYILTKDPDGRLAAFTITDQNLHRLTAEPTPKAFLIRARLSKGSLVGIPGKGDLIGEAQADKGSHDLRIVIDRVH